MTRFNIIRINIATNFYFYLKTYFLTFTFILTKYYFNGPNVFDICSVYMILVSFSFMELSYFRKIWYSKVYIPKELAGKLHKDCLQLQTTLLNAIWKPDKSFTRSFNLNRPVLGLLMAKIYKLKLSSGGVLYYT